LSNKNLSLVGVKFYLLNKNLFRFSVFSFYES